MTHYIGEKICLPSNNKILSWFHIIKREAVPLKYHPARRSGMRLQGRTTNHSGVGGGPWSDGPIFFSPRFFLGTKIFEPKLGPIFFFHFLPLCPMGENQWLDFLFFQKFWPDFFFRSQCPDRFFFQFRTTPPLDDCPPLSSFHLRRFSTLFDHDEKILMVTYPKFFTC